MEAKQLARSATNLEEEAIVVVFRMKADAPWQNG